ncbi:hypothetical protein EDB84DRAFT_1511848 [Lactarius hengduanensis]|nr:hypothetical protein EDB84DRAFT_1511848 [Lactarius hengduanensis]
MASCVAGLVPGLTWQWGAMSRWRRCSGVDVAVAWRGRGGGGSRVGWVEGLVGLWPVAMGWYGSDDAGVTVAVGAVLRRHRCSGVEVGSAGRS